MPLVSPSEIQRGWAGPEVEVENTNLPESGVVVQALAPMEKSVDLALIYSQILKNIEYLHNTGGLSPHDKTKQA